MTFCVSKIEPFGCPPSPELSSTSKIVDLEIADSIVVAIDALFIDKLPPEILLTFSLERLSGSVMLPVFDMVVIPAAVDKLIPVPAARLPPMSPVMVSASILVASISVALT